MAKQPNGGAKAPTMFDESPWFLFKPGARLIELQSFYEQGVIAALHDALVLLREFGGEPPEWVLEGAIRVVADRLKHGFSTGKGQSGNELAKYRNDMMHFRRWQLVEFLRSKKKMPLLTAFAEASDRLKGKF